MARPYSMDLRERAVTTVERDGTSRRQAAARFGVAVSTVIKWVQRFRRTGTVAPGRMGGHRPKAIAGEHRHWLIERCRSGDFTLRGLVAELAERGLKVDYRTVWAFVHAEKLSYKKPFSPASGIAPTWRAAARNGAATSRGLSRRDLSLSTKPGPRRTWRRCADGARAASGSSAKSLMATGT